MTYIGIDPGQKGGIAVLGDTKYTVYPYSDDWMKEIAEMFKNSQVFAVVEKVGAMPGQGVTSMFNFGKSFGYILGVLEANKIPYQLVPPQTWKKEFSLNKEKGKSVETAKRLFPDASLLPTARCKKESDGMAEALLIALYAKRLEGRK